MIRRSASEMRRLLRSGPGDEPIDRLFELVHADRRLVAPGRQQRGLVDEVLEIGAGEAGGPAGEHGEVDVGCERDVTRVHGEDLDPPVDVGSVDHDLPVEAARAEERGVEDVGAVRRREDDHAARRVEAVHLHQQLVERLLTLVVPATDAGTAVTADGVELVHEDDRRRRLLRVLEQLADAGRAHSDEHLHEVGSRQREERHARLARDRACEQRLAGSGRTREQHALRDACAHRREARRIDEEVADLGELLHRLRKARDVGERHRRSLDRTGLLAELEQAAPALGLTQQHDDEHDDEHERRQTQQGPDEPVLLLGVDREVARPWPG